VLDGARAPEGAEEILYVHARMLAACGRADDAPAAPARARKELLAKARRIKDEALRATFVAAPPAREILPHPGCECGGGARWRQGRRMAFDLTAALARVAGRGPALILTHDNPDPDSMAGAEALALLLRSEAHIDTTIARGGIVGRAENRAMVSVLGLDHRDVS